MIYAVTAIAHAALLYGVAMIGSNQLLIATCMGVLAYWATLTYFATKAWRYRSDRPQRYAASRAADHS